MGEIKSTMELVLEKTKGLTLTGEDREKLAREELEKRIQGLISKYLDQLIPVGQLTEEKERMADTDKDLAVRLIKEHLLARFDFDRDNTNIISALEQAAGVDTASLVALHDEYRAEKEEAKKEATKKCLEMLEEKGVSGAAVVPNLGKEPTWKQFLEELRKRYQERLEAVAL